LLQSCHSELLDYIHRTVWASEATFVSNEEVEVADGECLQMQEPDLYCNRNFTLLPRFDRCINVSVLNNNDTLVE
jgi:hypothetical protein